MVLLRDQTLGRVAGMKDELLSQAIYAPFAYNRHRKSDIDWIRLGLEKQCCKLFYFLMCHPDCPTFI